MSELTVAAKTGDIDLNNYESIWGGMDEVTLDEYLRGFTDNYEPYIKLIVDLVKSSPDLLGKCADERPDDLYFEFSDGKQFSLSWRAWGDLQAAIADKGENYLAYMSRASRDEGFGCGKKWNESFSDTLENELNGIAFANNVIGAIVNKYLGIHVGGIGNVQIKCDDGFVTIERID